MKTIDIKGKPYVQVNERLKAFRAEKPDYALITDIISMDDNQCTLQAKIIAPNGFVLATGTAHEERDDRLSIVNKTSFVENCETSAWGRALGNIGYGIDESIATADEVLRAITKQDQIAQHDDKQVKTTKSTAEPEKLTLEKAQAFKTKSGKRFSELTIEQLEYIVGHTTSDEISTAANIVLDSKQLVGDMEPIPNVGEGDLPF